MTNSLSLVLDQIQPVSAKNLQAAYDYLNTLTKPPGSLGVLEDWAARYAAIKGVQGPRVEKKSILLFAADHGVVKEGVSAYPQEVTSQMVRNFLNGGAAINVLARHMDTDVRVIDMGVNHRFEDLNDLVDHKIDLGTKNLRLGPAMTLEQAENSIEKGIQCANECKQQSIDLIGTGDMGIGNTTSSSAILSVLSGEPPERTTGKGTGIDDSTWDHKVAVIQDALRRNHPDAKEPMDVLAKVGGFEIGGIVGLILGAASQSIPVVVDGIVSLAAAALAQKMNGHVRDYVFTSHQSTEPGCQWAFNILNHSPMLDLKMRLGEGTGAVIAMNLLEGAVKLYSEMATFDDAGISNKNS